MESIYRHPLDEVPELQSMSSLVLQVKQQVEAALCRARGLDADHISERAEKTLDTEIGSDIVDFTLGCPRFMTLRSKSGATIIMWYQLLGIFRKCHYLENNSLFALGLGLGKQSKVFT